MSCEINYDIISVYIVDIQNTIFVNIFPDDKLTHPSWSWLL